MWEHVVPVWWDWIWNSGCLRHISLHFQSFHSSHSPPSSTRSDEDKWHCTWKSWGKLSYNDNKVRELWKRNRSLNRTQQTHSISQGFEHVAAIQVLISETLPFVEVKVMTTQSTGKKSWSHSLHLLNQIKYFHNFTKDTISYQAHFTNLLNIVYFTCDYSKEHYRYLITCLYKRKQNCDR